VYKKRGMMKMKKIIMAFIAGIIMLSFNSCTAKDQEYSYTIKDALKISAWVVDENFDINDWVTDEEYGAVVERDYVNLERLKLNKVRTMAPLCYRDMLNLNIFFEFDGIIEVSTDDECIRLDYNNKNPTQPGKGGAGDTILESVRWPLELYVNVCPLDKYTSATALVRSTAKIGKEYYLNVNAYRFDNEETPVIRAQLKLVVLEDKALFNIEDDNVDFFGLLPKERSRFFSIELISYEYSDVYIILDELWDDEDDE